MFTDDQLRHMFADGSAELFGASGELATAEFAAASLVPSSDRVYQAAKRAMDVAIAIAALTFVGPLFLAIALLVKLDSRGPVLFRQSRTGRNGRVFRILKFRSMRVHEQGDFVAQATRGDTRVTRVGAFLRRSSLDELPQFINVLMGDMSVVGPRPHAMEHDAQIARVCPAYSSRFAVKPGITGLAQVRGLRGECHTAQCLIDRLTADREYIRCATIRLDLAIVLYTIPRLIFDRAAY